MGLKRNNKTNLLLGLLSGMLKNSNNSITEFPITLNVSGQLISGLLISENEFYDLEINTIFKEINTALLGEKSKYFDMDGNCKAELTEEEIDNIPDVFMQKFIYLKNARYISGNTFLPSEDSNGAAIQVRLADVSSYSNGVFSTNPA